MNRKKAAVHRSTETTGPERTVPGSRTRQAGRGLRQLAALAATCALTVTALTALAGGASADTAPVNPADPKTPVTVSSDPLPTAQLDGVAWQQVVVGDTVYVAGKFSKARPAGAAAGSQTVSRNNVLAYRLSTGELLPFTANLNGQALSIAASPDGSRIYVGGEFTQVNGTARSRIVALNAADGSVISSFNPKVGGTVRAIATAGDTVYAGGIFSNVGSVSRSRLAAFRAGDGALLPWNPKTDNRVNALVVSPDGRQVVIGGAFSTLNGSSRPGFGLGRVDAVSGASMSLGVNNTVRNSGTNAAILSLSSDGTNFYGTGYIYRASNGTGNLEGSFSGKWGDGNLQWVEDCHGDTYGVWASSTAVYVAGHNHDCRNFGGFPEVNPRVEHRAVAFSKAATGVMAKDTQGWPSFTGIASPSMLNWFPDLDTGTASGQSQGPWAVAGNEQYVTMAGEFRNVNNKPQQGLVRFAVRQVAPNADGPRVSGAKFNPTLTYKSAGTVQVDWKSNWDRDNESLTYQVIRDSNPTPVYTTTQTSRFYNRPNLSFTNTGLAAGEHSYRIVATDPLGNTVKSDILRVNVPVGAPGGPAPEPEPQPQPGAGASDDFGRTGSGGWGTAATGGAWTHTGSAGLWSVDGAGKMSLNKAGLGLTARLNLAQQDSVVRVDTALDKVPNGGGAFLTIAARKAAAGEYQGVVKVSAAGAVTVDLVRVAGGTSTKVATKTVPGLTYAAGSQLAVRFSAVGSGSTALGIKVWPAGGSEPSAWTVTATDTTAGLQQPGTVALTGYISGSTTNVPVTAAFDNLRVTAQ
ncbi:MULTISPECIES: delta-60 repeat domain-containing protein [unclassified Arthrobacter]|uniref:delta-60 repeat domain-containing protein n=1 Tax=unclassified Arthrobacter TaxID=235627 RepID=UPI001D1495DA|nr:MULTISPECIES: delta-60 repeat domain-containing protein [unclassified Arthrobacter]MCC3277234.1 delta-60 repeat domain-containing protein [Arthrobacter sp. zg-Y20]MCC9179021.1 delta-60 repeat domain-containing protein [Arthrobacter sp. zg-Y750]MDK1317394.1 delta-60 repeat domain-containing protein [Arthrobacter sp. zg.Y20]WIB07167.1 delta-60 repeat domain-containing protein [Arthrobacter sp. zg-Y20]